MTVNSHGGGPSAPAPVALIGPGEAFGWSALVEPRLMTLNARAIEPSTILVVEGAPLRETMRRDRDIGYAILQNLVGLLAHRLSQTREALVYERGWMLVA